MPVDQGTMVTLANVVILVNLEGFAIADPMSSVCDINDQAQGLTVPIRFEEFFRGSEAMRQEPS